MDDWGFTLRTKLNPTFILRREGLVGADDFLLLVPSENLMLSFNDYKSPSS
jgi:hypothetical protein